MFETSFIKFILLLLFWLTKLYSALPMVVTNLKFQKLALYLISKELKLKGILYHIIQFFKSDVQNSKLALFPHLKLDFLYYKSFPKEQEIPNQFDPRWLQHWFCYF